MSNYQQDLKESFHDKMFELTSDSLRHVYYQEEDPAKIWNNVLFGQPDDLNDFKNICKVFRDMAFSGTKGWFAKRLAALMYSLIYRKHGHFVDESDWLSEKCDNLLSRSHMAFVQRAYTWAHIGCSTLCVWDAEKRENVCMRSLDWQGASALGKATRVFEFKGQDNQAESNFYTVGVVGMLGVLTGIKKGFSVAINYAPWYESSMDEDSDPTFKLRKLMQNPSINSFDKALGAIQGWEVSSPVFITLCGKEKDQACVIEIGIFDKKNIRYSQNGVLVQTNYFDPNGPFGYVENKMPEKKKQKDFPVDTKGKRLLDDDWYCGKLIPSSAKRREILESRFKNFSGSSVELEKELVNAYKAPPVWNYETAYWALMRPGTGLMRVFARKRISER